MIPYIRYALYVTPIIKEVVNIVLGEEILDEELDDATLDRFYDEYRKLENLLPPSKNKNNSSDWGDKK